MVDESGISKEALLSVDLFTQEEEDSKYLKKYLLLVNTVTKGLDDYDFQNTGEMIYQFVWHDLADGYIEYVKTSTNREVSLSTLLGIYKGCLKLLHPYMPFVTEAIWKELPKEEKESNLIALASWPVV